MSILKEIMKFVGKSLGWALFSLGVLVSIVAVVIGIFLLGVFCLWLIITHPIIGVVLFFIVLGMLIEISKRLDL